MRLKGFTQAEVRVLDVTRPRAPVALTRIEVRPEPDGTYLFEAMLGVPPNLREIVSAADGVTYWASSAKAVSELGFMPRSLEVGLRDAFGSD